MQAHFAHYRKENCAVFSEGETEEHLKGKLELAKYLKKSEEMVQLEAYLPDLKQRPDILIEKSNEKIAIEFQCSPITIEKMTERTQGYLEADYDVIWILGTHFSYKKHLTNLHKAGLYFSSLNDRFLLFHYNAESKELTIRYNFLLNTTGEMICKRKIIQTDKSDNDLIKLSSEKELRISTSGSNWLLKKHKELMKGTRYPSVQMLDFLSLIYKNNENMISIPVELYQHLSSEWLIQTYHMNWKYQLVLWLENHSVKQIITRKSLSSWLADKIKSEEIIYCAIQELNKELSLKPILEFLDTLVGNNKLKKLANQKWSYQEPLNRFKTLEEKFKRNN